METVIRRKIFFFTNENNELRSRVINDNSVDLLDQIRNSGLIMSVYSDDKFTNISTFWKIKESDLDSLLKNYNQKQYKKIDLIKKILRNEK